MHLHIRLYQTDHFSQWIALPSPEYTESNCHRYVTLVYEGKQATGQIESKVRASRKIYRLLGFEKRRLSVGRKTVQQMT